MNSELKSIPQLSHEYLDELNRLGYLDSSYEQDASFWSRRLDSVVTGEDYSRVYQEAHNFMRAKYLEP